MIGISNPRPILIRYGPGKAVVRGMQMMGERTRELFKILGLLLGRQRSAVMLAGPIGIVDMSRQQLRLGFGSFLAFMAMIGLNLTIINLFPVPVLDGGHLLFHLIEGVRRRPISIRVQMAATRVAVGFIVFFGLFLISNDVARIIGQIWLDRAMGG